MYNPENVLISNLAMHLVCGVSVLNWTDDTTPRTERPVRFYPKGRPAPYPGPTDVCVEQAYGTSFRVSDAIRVF